METEPGPDFFDLDQYSAGERRISLRAKLAEKIQEHAIEMGGTANLAVLGGNLPPSWILQFVSRFIETSGSKTCGLVAHRNGQVARSTRNSTTFR